MSIGNIYLNQVHKNNLKFKKNRRIIKKNTIIVFEFQNKKMSKLKVEFNC